MKQNTNWNNIELYLIVSIHVYLDERKDNKDFNKIALVL